MVPMGLFVAKVCTVLHVGQVPGALERPMRFNQDNVCLLFLFIF
jgi:hypothetical protein